ncbi:EVE domain-containing protein [Pseudohongiella spirulinae]|uniref:EVE domain-containing protein n=1 Tax=Pseudohongiella spirulinae TaxID=1249552 RepID=UPI00071763AB|nr:EVE domain-containing protein [Pseudohongiella spirulinae]
MAKWLMKTEPDECSIDDFAAAPDKPIVWEGVRNYQARNFMRQMAEGDEVFIYHSSCKHIGVAGIVKVTRGAYPDPSQFNTQSIYFDSKSSLNQPRWDTVDLVFVSKLPRLIPLDELKLMPELCDMALVKKGNRLSVMPVSQSQADAIIRKLGAGRTD